MNNDLISRSALKQSIKSYADDQYAENEYLGECAIMTIIDNAPAIPNEYMRGYEAAEREYKRPQGEWIEGRWQTAMECNYCGCPCQQYVKNFCANCGAEMRGKEE